jgi:tol-pal system protein YbgF
MKHRYLPLLIVLALTQPAWAGLFDDEEARKKVLAVEQEMRNQDRAIGERIDKLDASLKSLGILELVSQLDLLKADISRLRGQMEVLGNQINVVDKKQRDFYLDIDSRLKRVEEPGSTSAAATPPVAAGATPPLTDPTLAAADAKAAAKAAAAEKKAYDDPYKLFQKGEYSKAIVGFQNFLDLYPQNANAASAQYWLGLAHYNMREFKPAQVAQQALIKRWPDSPKVPDAMLALAAIQSDEGNAGGARDMMEDIIARYPQSEAAGKARQRLAGLKR